MEVDAIYVCYAKFWSAIRQVPQIVQQTPIEPPVSAEPAKTIPFQFEADPALLAATCCQELPDLGVAVHA